MPDFHTAGYTGGYTSARNDQSSRAYQEQQMAHIREMIARSQFEQQMEQEKRQRRLQGEQVAGGILPQLIAAMAGGAPPIDGGPQPPEPGQASVPMLPPGAPPAAMMPPGQQDSGAMTMPLPPQAPPPMPMPSGPPPGQQGVGMYDIADSMSPLQRMLAQADAEQNGLTPMPAGWKPSPVAPEALGGMPPSATGPDQGSGVQIGPDGDALLPPPPMPKGPTITIEGAIAAMQKKGVPAQQIVPALEAMLPAINAQNAHSLANFKAETTAQKAAIDAYKSTILAYRAGTYQQDVNSKGARREAATAQGDRRLDQADTRLAQNGAGGADATGFTPEGLDMAAEQYRQKGTMPPLGFSGKAARVAVINRAAELDAAANGSVAGSPGRQAEFKANSTALTQLTKDLTAIAPYQDMLEKNGAILKTLAANVVKTNSALANQPINWIGENVTGNPDVAEYLAQIQIFKTEAARVLNNPRLVGQLTDSARIEMEGIVKGTLALGQTERVVDRLLSDGTNRVNAMETQSGALRKRLQPGGGASTPAVRAAGTAPTNPKGWKLNVDASGNKAYVSPDGKQFEEVQ